MIRDLLIAILAVASTVGGGSVALVLGNRGDAGKPDPRMQTELVKLEPIAVPVVRKGGLQGYVTVQVSLSVGSEVVKSRRSEIVAYGSEAVLRSIYEEERFDFTALQTAELSTLSKRIEKLIGARLGPDVVSDAAIVGLRFVSKDEARRGTAH